MEELIIEEIHKRIGENVARYRKEAGLSQLDLSFETWTQERFYSCKCRTIL